jgi:hypothetical protein
LWRGIGLGELLQKLLPEGKERVPWEKMATVLVPARLCEPSSELHIAVVCEGCLHRRPLTFAPLIIWWEPNASVTCCAHWRAAQNAAARARSYSTRLGLAVT